MYHNSFDNCRRMLFFPQGRTGWTLSPNPLRGMFYFLLVVILLRNGGVSECRVAKFSGGAFLTTRTLVAPGIGRAGREKNFAPITRRAADLSAESISSLTKDTETILPIEKIKNILPHRFPFLLVDKVVHFEPGKSAIGVKQVSMNEDQFNGHFPKRAVMPGVLQVEALAQLGGIVALQEPVSDGQGDFFFAGVDGVKWKRPVVPGDTLVMEAHLLSWKPKFGIAKMSGRAFVDGHLALDVKEMTFALVR